MEQKILRYSGRDTTISYDVTRCIHAAECVRGLPEVFDPTRKPWVEPDHGSSEQLLTVVSRCPTGALHVESAAGESLEPVPRENRAVIEPNGPIYVSGEIEVVTQQGETLLQETRLALCRCGNSENKPLCDGRHSQVGFADEGIVDPASAQPNDGATGGLRLTTLANGPVLFEGPASIRGTGQTEITVTKGAFCRCGASGSKPFCDGSHVDIGFVAD